MALSCRRLDPDGDELKRDLAAKEIGSLFLCTAAVSVFAPGLTLPGFSEARCSGAAVIQDRPSQDPGSDQGRTEHPMEIQRYGSSKGISFSPPLPENSRAVAGVKFAFPAGQMFPAGTIGRTCPTFPGNTASFRISFQSNRFMLRFSF